MAQDPKVETVAPATTAAAVETTAAPAAAPTAPAAPAAAPAAAAPAAAPADLFETKTPVAGAANPERVRIITSQLAEYVEGMGSSQGDKVKMRKGMSAIISAIRLLQTLNGSDMTKALDAIVAAITSTKNGAFHESRIFSQMEMVPVLDRGPYVKILGTMVSYAKLQNKQRINDDVNLGYIADVFPDDLSRKAFLSYFPKK